MANEVLIVPKLSQPRLLNKPQDQKVKLLLSIQPADELRKAASHIPELAGVDVCLVIDVSTSMKEIIAGETKPTGQTFQADGKVWAVVDGGTTKIDAALAATKQLIPMLRDEDTISLITYESSPHIIFTGRHKNEQNAILKDIENSQNCYGATNISAAIRKAREMLSKFPKERPKKIIFLTDGQPTDDTENDGIREGEAVAKDGLVIDCLGFGNDFNLAFMEKVVTPSKGRSDHIKSPQDAKRVFSLLFKKAQDIVATNLVLKLAFSPQVRVTEHYRGAPENLYLGKVQLPDSAREYTLPLGVLERNQRYDYYFLLTVPPQGEYTGDFRILKAVVTYEIPSLQKSGECSKNVAVEFVSDSKTAEMRDSNVETGYALAEIKRLERECEDARNRHDKKTVVERYTEIIERYGRLGMGTEQKAFQQALEEYKKTGNVSLDILNQATRSSSKAADSGELSKTLGERDMQNIFGAKKKR